MKAVDANVIIHGRGLTEKLVTVREVLNELESDEASSRLAGFNVEERKPGEEAVRKVEEKSREINSETSSTDEKLAALALDLGTVLLTDDRELQNLAVQLDVKVEGFLDPKIEETRKWSYFCPVCGSKASGKCCGREPERKVVEKEPIQS